LKHKGVGGRHRGTISGRVFGVSVSSVEFWSPCIRKISCCSSPLHRPKWGRDRLKEIGIDVKMALKLIVKE
jgi:hypothetical protein